MKAEDYRIDDMSLDEEAIREDLDAVFSNEGAAGLRKEIEDPTIIESWLIDAVEALSKENEELDRRLDKIHLLLVQAKKEIEA